MPHGAWQADLTEMNVDLTFIYNAVHLPDVIGLGVMLNFHQQRDILWNGRTNLNFWHN